MKTRIALMMIAGAAFGALSLAPALAGGLLGNVASTGSAAVGGVTGSLGGSAGGMLGGGGASGQGSGLFGAAVNSNGLVPSSSTPAPMQAQGMGGNRAWGTFDEVKKPVSRLSSAVKPSSQGQAAGSGSGSASTTQPGLVQSATSAVKMPGQTSANGSSGSTGSSNGTSGSSSDSPGAKKLLQAANGMTLGRAMTIGSSEKPTATANGQASAKASRANGKTSGSASADASASTN